MDIFSSDSAPSRGSSDSEADPGLRGEVDRQDLAVGRRVVLRQFKVKCIGDNVTWKSDRLTRVVAVQAGCTGADRLHWGKFWGAALRDLGADVGAIAESRTWNEAEYVAACQGLLASG